MAKRRRAPRAPRGSAPTTLDFGSFMGGAGAGAAGASIASRYAASVGAGGPFRWQEQIGLGATIAGGIAGMMLPGGPGVWAALAGTAGSVAQSYITSGWTGQNAQAMYSALTGLPLTPFSNTIQSLGSAQGPWGGRINPMGAYQAMGALAPFVAGGFGTPGLSGLAAQMVGRYGPPDSAAYQSAAGALGAAGMNPMTSGYFANAGTGFPIGAQGVYGTYAALGPAGAFQAIAAGGAPSDMQAYQAINAVMSPATLRSSIMGYGAAATGSVLAGMMTGGGSSEQVLAALRGDEASLGNYAGALQAEADVWARGVNRGDPTALREYARVKAARAGVQAQRLQRQFAIQTRPASDAWALETGELQLQEQLGMMDPFYPSVPMGARRGLIGQYSGRIEEIMRRTAGDPAARRAMFPEIASLTQAMTAEQNAVRMGAFGELFNVSAGAPNGFQAWGLSAMGIRSMQRAVPGAPLGMGGSGEGSLSETNALLRELIGKLGAAFGSTGSTGGSNSPYSFAPDRSNRKIN